MGDLTVRGVRRRLGGRDVLDDLSLSVTSGEIVCLLGPSGSGKTTALRIIAGLEESDEGTILIDDRDVTALAPGARDVAMVFQDAALFPHLDVAGNIGFGLRVRKIEASARARRVAEAAELVGAGDLLGRNPATLSGGERQRVALARALVRKPAVLLLDEPLSSLDAAERGRLRGELATIQREVGVTMLHVTHDQTEALSLGDRVAVLDGGRVRQIATPDDLYRRPADERVATFVGSPPMALLPVVRSAGGVRVGPFLLDDVAAARVPAAAARAGIRAADVAVAEDAARGVDGVVVGVEMTGPELFASLEVDTAATIAVRLDGAQRPLLGSSQRIVVDVSGLHWFDEDGRRIS